MRVERGGVEYVSKWEAVGMLQSSLDLSENKALKCLEEEGVLGHAIPRVPGTPPRKWTHLLLVLNEVEVIISKAES